MSWRRAGAYVLLFLALAGYYAATEPSSDADGVSGPPPRAFLRVDRAAIVAVTIERGTARVRAVRDGERWRAEEPAGARVPPDVLAALIDQLLTMPEVETVSETGDEAAQFGLEPPDSRVTLMLRDGDRTTVALGSRNPSQTAAYGRVDGEARIVLLGLNLLYYRDLILQSAGFTE
jgi:hypothetical protein